MEHTQLQVANVRRPNQDLWNFLYLNFFRWILSFTTSTTKSFLDLFQPRKSSLTEFIIKRNKYPPAKITLAVINELWAKSFRSTISTIVGSNFFEGASQNVCFRIAEDFCQRPVSWLKILYLNFKRVCFNHHYQWAITSRETSKRLAYFDISNRHRPHR